MFAGNDEWSLHAVRCLRRSSPHMLETQTIAAPQTTATIELRLRRPLSAIVVPTSFGRKNPRFERNCCTARRPAMFIRRDKCQVSLTLSLRTGLRVAPPALLKKRGLR